MTTRTATDAMAALTIGKSVTVRKTVGETDVYLFAGISGDFSPNHVDEEYMFLLYYGDYAKQAQAEVDLWTAGAARDKAEKVLLGLADETADSPSVDSWGAGLFWIDRIAMPAPRRSADIGIRL